MTAVTDVELSRDLSFATVYFSIPGSKWQQEKALLALDRAKGFLRSRIAQSVRMMKVPELIIKEDSSYAYAMNIEAKLAQIKADDAKREAAKAKRDSAGQEDSVIEAVDETKSRDEA